jgi:uncharacterized membrane protein
MPSGRVTGVAANGGVIGVGAIGAGICVGAGPGYGVGDAVTGAVTCVEVWTEGCC